MIAARVVASGLIIMSTTTLAADSVQLRPGRWIETAIAESAMMNGKPIELPRAGPQTKHVCLTIAEAADPKLYFATVKNKDRCGMPTGSVNAGRIALVGKCTNGGKSETPSEIAIDGSYGGEAYAAKARMKTDMDGQAMTVVISVNGRFDGACHGDEEKHGDTSK